MPVDDPASIGLLLWGEISHETAETALIHRLAATCKTAIDIGAHFGWYSRLMAEAMGGKGRVFAFEPNPRTFRYLRENTRCHPEIAVFPLALSDSERAITFYCAESSNLSSAVRSVGRPEVLEAKTLDQLCQTGGIGDQIDFIKCDVEGGEMAVWRGANNVRCGANPPVWMLEVDDHFLCEAGVSSEVLNAEILANGSSLSLYCFDENRRLRLIRHIEDRQSPNIFVVPEARMTQWIAAAEL